MPSYDTTGDTQEITAIKPTEEDTQEVPHAELSDVEIPDDIRDEIVRNLVLLLGDSGKRDGVREAVANSTGEKSIDAAAELKWLENLQQGIYKQVKITKPNVTLYMIKSMVTIPYLKAVNLVF